MKTHNVAIRSIAIGVSEHRPGGISPKVQQIDGTAQGTQASVLSTVHDLRRNTFAAQHQNIHWNQSFVLVGCRA